MGDKQKLIMFTEEVQTSDKRDANVQTGPKGDNSDTTDYAGDSVCCMNLLWAFINTNIKCNVLLV